MEIVVQIYCTYEYVRVEVLPTDTVLSVKAKIEEARDPRNGSDRVGELWLGYDDSPMGDHHTLAHYGVGDGNLLLAHILQGPLRFH